MTTTPSRTEGLRHHALNRLQGRLSALASEYETAVAARTLLVIAPHPDDETIGCGGVIALARRRGVEVNIAFVTFGDASHDPAGIAAPALREIRRKEACEAAARLGVRESALHFLGIPDGQVTEHAELVTRGIGRLAERLKPEAVFLPHAKEPPPDHYMTFACGKAALEQCGRPVRIFEYGVWYWQHWPWVTLELSVRANSRLKWSVSLRRALGAAAFRDYNCMLDIGDVLPVKKHALEAHASQFGAAGFSGTGPRLGELEDGLVLGSWLQNIEPFRRTQLTGK